MVCGNLKTKLKLPALLQQNQQIEFHLHGCQVDETPTLFYR